MPAINLPPRCDRAAAEALYIQIIETNGNAAIKLDATDVENIGQAMLQLLIVTAKSDIGIELTGSSYAFNHGLALAKLNDVFAVGKAT